MNRIIHLLFLCLLAGSCAPSSYEVIGRQPTLSVQAPTTTEQGRAFTIEVMVQQTGISEAFSLSTVLLTGKAVITLDGTVIDTNGKWVSFGHNTGKLIVTPTTPGELKLNLQAKSSTGEISERQPITISITPATEITATTSNPDQLINPGAETRIPVQLKIIKDGYEGNYTVTAKVIKGEGKVYRDNYAINDMEISCGASTALEYCPGVLGEHIVELTIQAGAASTSAFIYLDTIKEISVASDITDCFTISGAGRHNTNGEEVTFSLVNNPGYNFEVAGWYDGDKLLSATPTYTLKLSKACLSDLTIKLATRTVNLSQDNITLVKNAYLIQQNGKPVQKFVYEHRTGISADFKVSASFRFFFHGSQYDMGVIPPVIRNFSGTAEFPKGLSWMGHLYRVDGKFTIYIRKADNPDFKFNYSKRYIESGSSRYIIPSNIIMQ